MRQAEVPRTHVAKIRLAAPAVVSGKNTAVDRGDGDGVHQLLVSAACFSWSYRCDRFWTCWRDRFTCFGQSHSVFCCGDDFTDVSWPSVCDQFTTL